MSRLSSPGAPDGPPGPTWYGVTWGRDIQSQNTRSTT